MSKSSKNQKKQSDGARINWNKAKEHTQEAWYDTKEAAYNIYKATHSIIDELYDQDYDDINEFYHDHE